MKLIAITQFTYDGYPPDVYLEIGKMYEGDFTPTVYDPQTLKPSKPSYIIKCDDGKYRKFMTEHFITLEEWREKQIDKILL
jgi:hypothetical protein